MLSREQIETWMAEGVEAYLNGMAIEDCHYPITSAQFASWLRGFQNAAFGAAMNRQPRSDA